MSMRRVLWLVLCLVGISSQSSLSDEFLEINSFRWSADLAPGNAISVTNAYGDVRIRNSKQGGLGVSAIIQNLQQNQEAPNVDIVENEAGNGYRIAVTYLDEISGTHNYKGRVDVTLLVPLETSIAASTTFGNIYARFKGSIQADAKSGNLSIDSPGDIQANTDSGSIVAWLKNNEWREPITFETKDGDITVKLKSGADATIHAKTKGRRTMRSSSGVHTPLHEQDDTSVWKLGQGTSELTIESASGNIEIFIARSLEAVSSAASAPVVVKKDLGALPRSETWTPGQAIKEVPRN